VSKLLIECAQLEERNGHVQRARARVRALCGQLRWKVWLGGTRIELTRGQLAAAHALRWKVWLGGTRIELTRGQLAAAHALRAGKCGWEARASS